jgi:hypothetical protein
MPSRRATLSIRLLAILALWTLACYPRRQPPSNMAALLAVITFDSPYPLELSYAAAGSAREAVSYERVTAIRGRLLAAFNDTVIVAVSYLTLEGTRPDRPGPTIRVATTNGAPTAVIVDTPDIHVREVLPERDHSFPVGFVLILAFSFWYVRFHRW